MLSHCLNGSDLACCGLLAGVPPCASAIYPLRNAAESEVHYSADPSDLIRAALDIQGRGLTILAIYHFCPGTPAIPSPTDVRENNYGDLPRVIVSLGKVATVRVWRLTAPECEELDWRLLPREGGTASEDGEGPTVRPEVERSASVRESPTLLGSVLSCVFWWRRPSTRVAIGRPPNLPTLGPGPMWDPLLDGPQEHGFRDG